MSNRLEKAREWARVRHALQRYGAQPYRCHLDHVERIAAPFGEQACIVAQLHDILEDTATRVDEISALFGPTVARAVMLVTDPRRPSREERKRALNQRLIALDPSDEAAWLALVVKTCDRLANVIASSEHSLPRFQQYQREHGGFRIAVYRPGLCDHLWRELDGLIDAGQQADRHPDHQLHASIS
ncbi:HD domain-containing protein [Salinivibrio kushneri]|uniref:HD domain-containing protein n=1 Tax=Salinivibrio kushneri TaxID=1908198 RepID=A0AA47KNH5_9GAMM|nr:HD domain-containing protein [Salinivibrio kushneri]WBA10205.1 HD domain-containing protein [Salinivibrio kushneri]